MNPLVLAYRLVLWGEAIRRRYPRPYQFEKAIIAARGRFAEQGLGKNRKRRRGDAGKDRRMRSLERQLVEVQTTLDAIRGVVSVETCANRRILRERKGALRLALLRLEGVSASAR